MTTSIELWPPLGNTLMYYLLVFDFLGLFDIWQGAFQVIVKVMNAIKDHIHPLQMYFGFVIYPQCRVDDVLKN